jgi:hypothetical protein
MLEKLYFPLLHIAKAKRNKAKQQELMARQRKNKIKRRERKKKEIKLMRKEKSEPEWKEEEKATQFNTEICQHFSSFVKHTAFFLLI